MVLDFDVILEDVGDFGIYQKFAVYLLTIPACFMNAFGLAFVFLGYTPDYACVPRSDPFDRIANQSWPMNATSLIRACSYEVNHTVSGNETRLECERFTYDKSYFKSTIVTEWDLVCDRAIYPKTMMAVHSLVTLVGCLVNSYFQDLWGRKITFFIVLTTNLIGNISCVFAPTFLVYAVLRSFSALATTSTWNVSYTWALEYVGPSKRSMVTMIMCVMYGLAAMMVGLLAYLCDTWIKLTLAGTVPYLLLYTYGFLVDESPRWLLSRGRNKEALKTVRKMARWQKKTLMDETVQKLLSVSVEVEDDVKPRKRSNRVTTASKDKKQNPRVQDLFLTRNLRWKTCIITYGWAANLLTYLAIAYNMENLKGNLFLSYTLQAAMEVPASILIVFLLDRFGRIPPLSLSMIATGILLFITVPADSLGANPWVIVVLTLAAKFGISLSFGIIVQVAGESYPTQLRGLGTGFSSFVGSLGATVMPYVVHSATAYKMLPQILMGITAVTSGLSLFMLPETMGRYMPETIEEAEKGENVGLVSLKENWSQMKLCGRKSYRQVAKADAENEKRQKILNENEQL